MDNGMDPLHFLIGLVMGQNGVSNNHLTEAERIPMKITTIGLDIAKSVFHLYAVNKMGRYVKKKQLKRQQ